MSTPQDMMFCLLIVVVAVLGKYGGAYLASRWSGLSRRESSTLGVFMNTRGLVELIVLNAGLDAGLIGPTLFTQLVIMAVVTTMMTGPLPKLHLRGARDASI